MSSPPQESTLGELRRAGFESRPIRSEIRANLVERLRSREPLFTGIHGYGDSVVPALENALLSGHDLVFLGERGQAKSRMIRALTCLFDEWIPEVHGSETRDDPLLPVSARGRKIVHERGDDTPIRWVHRDERYVEKLATPDVSVADLIGDIDPIKVAEGRSLSDELTMHFGLLPRANRGIFCINELPDLAEKVQVSLFNVMQERDVQIKGYAVRLPLDVLVVASANPDDYTSRGRIISPLKDRYAAQIRTHYPTNRSVELDIVLQEARVPIVPGIAVRVPRFMQDSIVEITHQARMSPDVNQASGVSVRMSISNYETLIANAVRRALALGESEAAPRVSDLTAIRSSMLGKLELEYAGRERSEYEVAEGLVKRALKSVFDEVATLDELRPVISAFDEGWQVEVSPDLRAADYLTGLDEIPRLREVAHRIGAGESPAALASAIEFLLEGLHLSNRLNKTIKGGTTAYGKRASP
jgi:magnesium chelatase subunit I